MALPKWITPAGNLGIIPELEYYQFDFDAYDASGGTLVYSRVSGRFPLGIQLVNSNGTGRLQGIPVSEKGGDQNVEYRFTIRVKNSSTNEVADRTFTITVSNIAPPIITPKNVDLGLYLDGTIVNLQLEAIEFTPGATLTWRVKSGDLPSGLYLSDTGLLYGYIKPIPEPGAGATPGWDLTPWDYDTDLTDQNVAGGDPTPSFGWDFPLRAINKTFNFTVEVYDGVNYDTSTYRLEVFPRSSLTADNDVLTVDYGDLSTGEGLADIEGAKHDPIIITTQADLPPIRQGSYFSFNVDALDLDGDVLQYSIPSSASGAFDEQIISGPSLPYVAATPIGSLLYGGANNLIDTTSPGLIPGDNIKVFYNGGWYEASVDRGTTIRLVGNVIVTANVGNTVTQTGTTVNATVTNISATTGFITFGGNLVTANVGDYITQTISGANATITANVYRESKIPVTYTSGTFTAGSGNVSINGSAVGSYPTDVLCYTDLSVDYSVGSDTFSLTNSLYPVLIGNGTVQTSTLSYPVQTVSVEIALGSLAIEGTVGFDEGRFDQGTLALPLIIPATQLSQIDANTGWITGTVPAQTITSVDYQFELVVFKRDYPTYRASRLYTITVLGDLNDTINWITPENLGTIENGRISDLYVQAESTKGKPLFYSLKSNGSHRLPQGLVLLGDGLISGRVSFEIFTLDAATTTIDNGRTTFDNTYTFTVTAQDYQGTISEDRTFTLRVAVRNTRPYEDLYLEAMLSLEQRTTFNQLMADRSIFPLESIYRTSDPFFGVAGEIRTLFLAGLSPSTLTEYALSLANNHFVKRVEFGDVKTAVVLDTNFDVKYEVVYVEIFDENTSVAGEAPANTINLTGVIDTPYYDLENNPYTIAYPNAFDNMSSTVIEDIGYEDKGALPDWMTSRQPNGRVLGFTRAVVLAYTMPGASAKIAYRLKTSNFNFNQLDFTVDRYMLDNSYSQNYDYSANAFITAEETTFDRYPSLSSVFVDQGTVDYALNVSYEDINNRLVPEIQDLWNGMDGIKNFHDGDTIVFATQEFFRDQFDAGDYNQGWTDVQTIWDGDSWDYDSDLTDNPYTEAVSWSANTIFKPGYTVIYNNVPYRVNAEFMSGASFAIFNVYSGEFDETGSGYDAKGLEGENSVPNMTQIAVSTGINLTPGLGWDAASYVPGYNEHLLDPNIPNKRIGVWRINISDADVVTLTFIQEININNTLYVRSGFTYGGTTIYYDPVVKTGFLYPNYSIIPQEVKTTYTTFDGNGTRFFSNRDTYTVPRSNDKYIKFGKLGVFN